MRITTQSPHTVNLWSRPHFLTPFCKCEHRFWEIFDQNWLTTQLSPSASIVLPLRRHPGLQFGRPKSLSVRTRGQPPGTSEGYTAGVECRPWAGQSSAHGSRLLSYRVLSAKAKGRVKLKNKSPVYFCRGDQRCILWQPWRVNSSRGLGCPLVLRWIPLAEL